MNRGGFPTEAGVRVWIAIGNRNRKQGISLGTTVAQILGGSFDGIVQNNFGL